MELSRKELEMIKDSLILRICEMEDAGPSSYDDVDPQSSIEEHRREIEAMWSLGDRVRSELEIDA